MEFKVFMLYDKTAGLYIVFIILVTLHLKKIKIIDYYNLISFVSVFLRSYNDGNLVAAHQHHRQQRYQDHGFRPIDHGLRRLQDHPRENRGKCGTT